MAAPCVCLTYFDARARAEPLRWILVQAGAKYNDKRIKEGDWPALKPSKFPTRFILINVTSYGRYYCTHNIYYIHAEADAYQEDIYMYIYHAELNSVYALYYYSYFP